MPSTSRTAASSGRRRRTVISSAGRPGAPSPAPPEPRWSRPFAADAAVTSTPVVVDGKLYVGALNERLYALDAATGELQWSFSGDDWIWTRAAVSAGVVYVGNLGGHVS